MRRPHVPPGASGRPVTSTDAPQVRHRSGGPRPDDVVPPLDLSGLGRQRATRAVRFMEGLHVPKGKGARSRLRLRPWQRAIVRTVLAPGVRTAVVAIPRGNGKSTLAAALGLWALVDGPEGAEVPIVAGVSERQARIAFNTARRMVELDTELVARVQIFQDRLYMPHHDASLFPLPADADALLGANPTMTLVDELGVIDAEVFEAMRLASGKRAESTLLAIGTPPREPESIMRTLVEHGRLEEDPTFALVEYAAPATSPVDDRQAWKQANPALGDFLYEDVSSASGSANRRKRGWIPRRGPRARVQICTPPMATTSCSRSTGAFRRTAPPSRLHDRGHASRLRGRLLGEPTPRRRNLPHRRARGRAHHPGRVPPVQRPRSHGRPVPLDPHAAGARRRAHPRERVPPSHRRG